MTDKENGKTPKEELTDRVEASPKEITVEYGGETYTIHRLPWKKFLTAFNTFREFVAEIIPSEVEIKDMTNIGAEVGFDIPKIIQKAPLDLLASMVQDSTDVNPEDDDTPFDLVLLLAGRSVYFNFIDNTGVQDFFSVIGRVVKVGTSQPSK